MKNIFITIKATKRNLLLLALLFFFKISVVFLATGFYFNLFSLNFFSTPQLYTPLEEKTIGIDPGHGGYDPGFYKGDVTECEIVLEVSLKLRRLLEQAGPRVIMTREEDIDYREDTKKEGETFKAQDLNKRLKKLENNEVDFFLSVHANSVPSSLWKGAQTFYSEKDQKGKELAHDVQDKLEEVLKNTDRSPLSGDFYILNESSAPGCIVEVGFLSNPVERELLTDEKYQERLAWAIYLGLLDYIAE